MIKELFQSHSREMKLLAAANILAIIGFFLLYRPFSPRPYSNLVYFLVMLLCGIYLARGNGHQFVKDNSEGVYWTLGGSALMLIIYWSMRLSHGFVSAHPALSARIDTGQWSFFVKPWVEMNFYVSLAGVLMIVVALEYFYRAYIQEFLGRHMPAGRAIFYAALLSGIRGFGGGSLGGPIDFMLALIWGWVYYKGGLLPSMIVHLVWDIAFVYFAP